MSEVFDFVRRLGQDAGEISSAAGILARVTLLLMATIAVLLVLRRSSASFKHLAWASSLMGTLLIPLFYWILPAWQWAVLPPTGNLAIVAKSACTPDDASRPSKPRTVISQGNPAEIPSYARNYNGNAIRNADRTPMRSPEPAVATSVGASTAISEKKAEFGPSAASATAPPNWTWPKILGAVWFGGSGLCLAWMTIGMAGAWIITRRAKPAGDPGWRRILGELLDRRGFSRPVEVRQCSRISVPMTWGLRQPLILIPEKSGDWPDAAKRSVLLHELGHIRRRDCLVQFLGRVAWAAYWFHPLVWLAVRQLRKTSEQAADDAVISADIAPPDYAEHLVRVAAQVRGLGWLGRVALPMAHPSELETRVTAILDSRRNRRRLTQNMCLASLTVGLMFMVLCAILQLGYAQDKTPLATVKPSSEKSSLTAKEKSPKAEKDSSATASKMLIRTFDAKTGKPLAEASILVRIHDPGYRDFTVKTDPDGNCSLDLPAGNKIGELSLEVHPAGFVPQYHLWQPRQSTTKLSGQLTLRFAPAISIGGQIQDELGKPVAGVEVNITMQPTYCEKDNHVFSMDTVKSDGEGKWSCPCAPADPQGLGFYCNHPDYLQKIITFAEDMKTSKHVMRLESGYVVSGKVFDANARPVEGLTASVGFDLSSFHDPKAKTDAQGHFEVKNCKPGASAVTIQGEGYAPQFQKLVVKRQNEPLTFRLEPAATLHGRAVDPQGNPLSGVWAATDTWQGIRTLNYRQDTDKEGRFVWTSAPREAVVFDFGKLGYMASRNISLTASDKEQTVTLYPELAIRGAVVDEETGKPIEEFRVYPGRTIVGSKQIHFPRDLNKGQNGRYETHFDEPSEGLYVKIEADGYEPAVSREFKPTEGEQTFDFKLKKGAELTGVILAADGKPVEKATVLLATQEHKIQIQNGHVNSQNSTPSFETDSAGRFHFLKPKTSYRLYAIHDLGYAQASPEEMEKSTNLVLAPWGRLEGKVRIGNRPGNNVPVSFQPKYRNPSDHNFCFDNRSEATTDQEGRFVMERVIPGKGTASRVVVASFGGSSRHAPCYFAPVEIIPGQTAQVEIGGTGRPVIGRIDTGKRTVEWPLNEMGEVTLKDRDEEETYRRYCFLVAADGTFCIEDVPAGKYELRQTISDPPDPNKCGPGNTLGRVAIEFTMPEIPGGRGDEPLDLGTIEANMLKVLKPGDPVPAAWIYTMDNQKFQFQEQRGKVVLASFWATWCVPCRAEISDMKRIYNRFRADPRFAMIGLSLDNDRKTLEDCIDKEGISWPQARVGSNFESGLLADFGVRNAPVTLLIGADGKIAARDLSGNKLEAAVEAALRSAKDTTTGENPSSEKNAEAPKAAEESPQSPPSETALKIAVAVLDDCDRDFQGPGPHGDGIRFLAEDGKELFYKKGLNNCPTCGNIHGVVIDPKRQRVYYAELVANRLTSLDFSGKTIFQEEQINASALAVDPKTGNLWCLVGGGEIAVYDTTGKRIASYSISGSDIVYDPHDEVFWIVGKKTLKMDWQGKLLFESSEAGWNRVSVSPNPKDGSVWIVERDHPDVEGSKNLLYHLDHNGKELLKIDLKKQDPLGVACDPESGTAWMVINRKGILRMPADGSPLPVLDVPAISISIGAETGQIWAATETEILRLDKEGKTLARYRLEEKSEQTPLFAR